MSNKTPIRVDASFTPSGTQDVNIVSSITLAISAASLPLPTGAATEATLLAVKTDLDKLTFTSTRLLVDGSGVIQPVSGTITANIGTTGGLALDSTLTNASQKTQITNSLGNAVTVQQVGTSLVGTDIGLTTSSVIYGLTTGGGGGYVEVKVTPSGALTADVSGSDVSVTNFPAIQPVSGTVTANQGTSPWVVSGTITTSPNVNVHDGTGTSISSTGSSLNVDVTNTVPVTGAFFQTTQPVSGVGNFIVVQSTGANLHTNVDNFPATQTVSGTVAVTQSTSPWVISGAVNAAQSGTWNINNISGIVSLPTGAATESTLATLNTNTAKGYGTWSYYSGTSGTVTVTAGQRVVGITAHATTAGSMTINGGSSIPIPANVGLGIEPTGNLVAPTIVFIGTDAYVVEVVM